MKLAGLGPHLRLAFPCMLLQAIVRELEAAFAPTKLSSLSTSLSEAALASPAMAGASGPSNSQEPVARMRMPTHREEAEEALHVDAVPAAAAAAAAAAEDAADPLLATKQQNRLVRAAVVSSCPGVGRLRLSMLASRRCTVAFCMTALLAGLWRQVAKFQMRT